MKNIATNLAIVLIASISAVTSYSTFAVKEASQKIGTWENKDEDGDGVPDELDDYPFDASRSTFFTLHESQQNNLVETADDVQGHFPFRITGTLPNSGDTDVFKVHFPTEQLKPLDRLSFTITSTHNHFYPTANLFDKNGTQLDTYRAKNIKPVNGLKYHFTYTPNGNEVGYLSISSLRQMGDASYVAEVSIDNDADGMDDIKEMAVGMNFHTADTDKDGIRDSHEYYVYRNGQLKTDIDNDGIANFLDDDSDGDGLPDQLESSADVDKDSLSNFVDIDSDGNGIVDKDEVVNLENPIDSDRDSIADYLDLDDDLDNVFDIYDHNRLVEVGEPQFHRDSLKIYGVSTFLSEQTKLSQQSIQGKAITVSGSFSANTEYIVVLGIGGELFNEQVTSDSEGKLTVSIPQLATIQTQSLSSSVFVYSANDTRTNEKKFELLPPQVPIITEFENRAYSKGEKITLKGWNFNSNTSAWFGELNVKSSHFSTSREIEFEIPQNIKAFSVQLQNGWGKGNVSQLMIKNEFSVQLSVPSELSSQYDRLYYDDADGNPSEFSLAGTASVSLPALSNPLLILNVKKNEKFIRLFSLPITSNDVQTVSLDTTLFSFITNRHPRLTPKMMIENAHYAAFYDYVYNKLKSDIYYFSFEAENSQNEFFAELQKFSDHLRQADQ